jgi:Asp-tRNA(Asn)/Glu-tRNA(Gln) amidotransferase A subunit family amidase
VVGAVERLWLPIEPVDLLAGRAAARVRPLDAGAGRPGPVPCRPQPACSFTPLYNLTSCPAISLPLPWSPAGLPIGVMFGAQLGGKGLQLRLAAQLQEARPRRGRLAPV